MTKTHKSRIKKWVEALRSGKYKQTRDALFYRSATRHYSYCCLGVACKVYQEANGVKDWESVHQHYNVLPPEVSKWFGFASYDPQVFDGDLGNKRHLTTLNDDMEVDFKYIANAIERTFLNPRKKFICGN